MKWDQWDVLLGSPHFPQNTDFFGPNRVWKNFGLEFLNGSCHQNSPTFSRWWCQPIWKILGNLDHFPVVRVFWNHHLFFFRNKKHNPIKMQFSHHQKLFQKPQRRLMVEVWDVSIMWWLHGKKNTSWAEVYREQASNDSVSWCLDVLQEKRFRNSLTKSSSKSELVTYNE